MFFDLIYSFEGCLSKFGMILLVEMWSVNCRVNGGRGWCDEWGNLVRFVIFKIVW